MWRSWREAVVLTAEGLLFLGPGVQRGIALSLDCVYSGHFTDF
jgi:hypothetical protein